MYFLQPDSPRQSLLLFPPLYLSVCLFALQTLALEEKRESWPRRIQPNVRDVVRSTRWGFALRCAAASPPGGTASRAACWEPPCLGGGTGDPGVQRAFGHLGCSEATRIRALSPGTALGSFGRTSAAGKPLLVLKLLTEEEG